MDSSDSARSWQVSRISILRGAASNFECHRPKHTLLCKKLDLNRSTRRITPTYNVYFLAMNETDSDLQNSEQGNSPKCRLIVVGSQVAALLRDHELFVGQFEVIGQFVDLDEWANLQGADQPADLVIVDCPSLFPDTIELINSRAKSAGALRAIVVYHFSQEATEEMMAEHKSGITAMRAPVSPLDLKLACEADLAMVAIRNASADEMIEPVDGVDPTLDPEIQQIPARRYSEAQLSKLARVSTAIDCECPHHMASLLAALNAFEQYSRECESKNKRDAMLHAFLHRRTAHARSMMEDALSVFAEAEGVDLHRA